MTLLVLSLGSNVDARANMLLAVKCLRRKFGVLSMSPVYESEAVGFSGSNFLNLVASVESSFSLEEIKGYLKRLEDSLGRERDKPKFSDRPIDIDILLFGDSNGEDSSLSLPRAEILSNAFVLRPLAELHPDLQHSALGSSFDQLWNDFDKTEQKLWRVDIDL